MITRRSFVRTLGVGAIAAPLVAARGREGARGWSDVVSDSLPKKHRGPADAIRLDSNENPNGPGTVALDAMRNAFDTSNRYPDLAEDTLARQIAAMHGVAPEQVLLGCGSTELLHMAVLAFTSPSPALALITAAPTFEEVVSVATVTGAPVVAVPVDRDLKLDLGAMARAASGAGLVYVCNPNNPTATVHGAPAISDFIAQLQRQSPHTRILIDEAYHEYVEEPAYATAIPLAAKQERVIVTRTFSKVFGLAGMRIGYAIAGKETIRSLGRWQLPSAVSALSAAAALATVNDQARIERERSLNHAARDFTRQSFESAGYTVVQPNANFMMIDIRRDAKEFQAACLARKVLVGRPFPPLNNYARISIGTMDEMQRATAIFREVLRMA